MRRVIEHSEFRSDYERAARHRKCNRDELDRVIEALAHSLALLPRHRPHRTPTLPPRST